MFNCSYNNIRSITNACKACSIRNATVPIVKVMERLLRELNFCLAVSLDFSVITLLELPVQIKISFLSL